MVTEQELRDLISEQAPEVDAVALGLEESFSDAGMDSLDHVTILLTLEERFGLEVPDEHVEECSSIAGILRFAAKS